MSSQKIADNAFFNIIVEIFYLGCWATWIIYAYFYTDNFYIIIIIAAEKKWRHFRRQSHVKGNRIFILYDICCFFPSFNLSGSLLFRSYNADNETRHLQLMDANIFSCRAEIIFRVKDAATNETIKKNMVSAWWK